MLKETLIKLYDRDIGKLRDEIAAYREEANLWRSDKAVSNSAGNLCLHLIGNLNAFIGAEIGDSGYERDRDREFSDKDIPREELLRMIDETRAVVVNVLVDIRPEIFWDEYPLIVFESRMTTGYFLVHLATHLNYHLGQINYHRRLLDAA